MTSIPELDLLGTVGAEPDFTDKSEQVLNEMLANLREVSDSLWQATATLGLTLGTLDNLESILEDMRSKVMAIWDRRAGNPLGADCASKLEALLEKATFQGVNLLAGNRGMNILVETSFDNGVQSKVFKSIAASNLSLDNGPFHIGQNFRKDIARILVLDDYNPTAAFGELETIRLRLSMRNLPSRTVTVPLTWAKTPQYICALIQARLQVCYPEIGQIPVTSTGTGIVIGPAEGCVIEAVSLQGPTVGAFHPIKPLLTDPKMETASMLAALELATTAVTDCRNRFKDKQEEVHHLEQMTLTLMERVALATIKPQDQPEESAALNAVKTAQLLKAGNFKLADDKEEILRLMLKEGPCH